MHVFILLSLCLAALAACANQSQSRDVTRKTAATPVVAMHQSKVRELQAVHMVDATTGWLWTQTGVWHTTDGGASWQDVTPRAVDGFIFAALSGVYVFNGAQALVTTMTSHNSEDVALLFSTRDSGRTWRNSIFPAQHLSPKPAMMSFIDAQNGWVEANFQGATGNDLVAIFRTRDGGQSWQPISQTPLGPSVNAPTTFPFAQHKSGLTFVDASTGWASTFADGVVRLYMTHDGGRSWQARIPSLPDKDLGFYMLPPSFFDAHNGILPVDVQAPDGSNKLFLVTHDGGVNWQSTTPAPAYLGTMADLDMSHLWVAAAQGTVLYASSDGARHWNKLTPTTAPALARFTLLDFVSPMLGWAVGQTGLDETMLLKTTDGGRTWKTTLA